MIRVLKITLALSIAMMLFITNCRVTEHLYKAHQPYVKVEVINQADFEPILLRLINDKRYELGQTELVTNTLLMQAAEAHSQDMADNNYLEHKDHKGGRAGERLTKVGYRWKYWGEVIAGGTASPRETFEGWMKSPRHKAVLLDEVYEEIGLGFVYDDTTKYHNFWTVVLTIPKDER